MDDLISLVSKWDREWALTLIAFEHYI
jgi:hypothetical protein